MLKAVEGGKQCLKANQTSWYPKKDSLFGIFAEAAASKQLEVLK